MGAIKLTLHKVELELDDTYFDLIMDCLPFLGYECFEDFIKDAVALRYGELLPLLVH